MNGDARAVEEAGSLDRFSYFMVRIQQRQGGCEVEGVIEQLSTGEKRSFANAVMLLESIALFLAAPLGTKD